MVLGNSLSGEVSDEPVPSYRLQLVISFIYLHNQLNYNFKADVEDNLTMYCKLGWGSVKCYSRTLSLVKLERLNLFQSDHHD